MALWAGWPLLRRGWDSVRHRALKTMRKIRQSPFPAFIRNAVGIAIAAAAMSLRSVSVIGNALRLRFVRL